MLKKSASMLGAVAAISLLASSPAGATGRFTYGGYMNMVPEGYTWVWGYHGSTNEYSDQMGCYYSPWHGTWQWDPAYGQYGCWGSIYQLPYLSTSGPVAMGDIIMWEPSGGFSITALVAPFAFPQLDPTTMKIHTTIVYEGDAAKTSSGKVSYLLHNTADFAVPTLTSCGDIDRFTGQLATQLTTLRPGITTGYVASRGELQGRAVLFHGTSDVYNTLINNANTATSGYYSLGGFSEYVPYSQCSEFAADKLNMSDTEGNGKVAFDYNAVYNIAGGIYNAAYRLCYDGSYANMSIPNWDGITGQGVAMCISQGGRSGVCTDMANSVVNAFLNRPYAGRSYWWNQVHATSNVTGTPDTFYRLKGAAPGVNGSGSYSASYTSSDTTNYSTNTISLTAGQTLTLGACNGGSYSGDTYLRLIGPSGGEVASNDDACGLGSQITYTVPTTGTYTVRRGCYSSGSCSATIAWSAQ